MEPSERGTGLQTTWNSSREGGPPSNPSLKAMSIHMEQASCVKQNNSSNGYGIALDILLELFDVKLI